MSCPADQLGPLTKTLTAFVGERCETVACFGSLKRRRRRRDEERRERKEKR